MEKIIYTLKAMGETVGYDESLIRVQPRLVTDRTNDWKLLTVAMKRAKGDFKGAAEDGERMRTDPANQSPARKAPILRALADVYQNQTPPNYNLARDRYRELLSISKEDLISLNNVAYMLAELVEPADPQGAKVYSKMAYEQTQHANEPNTYVMDTHGWILVLCGGRDLLEGKNILHAVVDANPQLIEGRYHLGEAYLRQEAPQYADAEKELGEARRLIEEEEKLGGTVDAKMKDRVLAALGKAQTAQRGR